MSEDIYLHRDRYMRLVEALAILTPCLFAGYVTPDQIKVTLGEFGDIWPMEIYGDVLAAHIEQFEKLTGCAFSATPS